MRYRLRTLLILMAVVPPALAWMFTSPDQIQPVAFGLAMYYAVGLIVLRLYRTSEC